MKKLLGIFLAALLVFGYAGQSLAALESLHLVRVLYQPGGTYEVVTDLGIIDTNFGLLTTSPTNVVVGGGASAFERTDFGSVDWNQLAVAYYAFGGSTGAYPYDAWVSGTGTQTSGSAKISGFNSASTNISAFYSGTSTDKVLLGGTTYRGLQGNSLAYWKQMDKNGGSNIGTFAGLIPIPNGSELSLAALATTGYVDQQIYYFNFSGLGHASANGVLGATLRTMEDGSTVINPAAPVVPIPPSFLLLGSGLLGLIGLRRRAS